MMPRRFWPGLLIAVMFVAACGSGDDTSEAKDSATDSATESSGKDKEEVPAIPVETATATRGDVYATYSGTAAIEAYADSTVVAKVGGEVRSILVEEGDLVKTGQILARLDGDRLRLEYEQTSANLNKLQRDYQRNVDLKTRGLISEGDFEKIRYEMEALDAANKLAALQLSYADIRSPINGVVSERFVKIGNTLEIDARTFQVTSLEPLVSYLHVPEREYRRIGTGQDSTIMVDALGGTTFPAQVARVSPVVDAATGTFKVTVEVTDSSRRLKPGMFARIAIVLDIHSNVLQVPRSALIGEGGSNYVFVIDNDVAHRRTVTTGFASEGRIEISDGISDTDHLVVVGHTGLKQGAKVVVINREVATDSNATAAKNEADE